MDDMARQTFYKPAPRIEELKELGLTEGQMRRTMNYFNQRESYEKVLEEAKEEDSFEFDYELNELPPPKTRLSQF